jgi:catechol 2,3-dioxygenase-like lactoylglutathione lyase family enzyme
MQTNTKFDFQGLDHVALGCSDMKRTADFYHGTLGMPILHTIEYTQDDEHGDPVPMGQHFFFGVGGDNPNAHIAFFYWKNGYQSLPDRDAGDTQPHPDVNPRAIRIGQMHHLNLRVAPDKIEQYCRTLAIARVDYQHVTRYADPDWREIRTTNGYTPPEPGCLMDSVYFDDPDHIHLELNAWLPDWDQWPNNHQPWADPR